MRFAVVSDLHANLQAWKAVLLDIRSQGLDKIICLGDLVGYGPNPAKVLESVHANVDYIVLGNHDAAACGKLDESLFNERAAQIIRWTRTQLNAGATEFLSSLPLSLDAESFRCTHADFGDPGSYQYLIDVEDVEPSWSRVQAPLLFVGHTHQPALFVRSAEGETRQEEPREFRVDGAQRYLVNVGSVGQPRDGEARASYVIYDTAEQTVRWRRIPFDLDAYREALETAGIDASETYFLSRDPRKAATPLREQLNFSPATRPEQSARDTVEVADIELLSRSVRKWKTFVVLLACLLLGLGGITGYSVWRWATRMQVIESSTMSPIDAAESEEGANLLRFPEGSIPKGRTVPFWRVTLGDRHKQSVGVVQQDNGAVFMLSSDNGKDEMRIASSPILVQPGMKLCFEALFAKPPNFTGTAAVVIPLLLSSDGTEERMDQFIVKQPNQPRQGGWTLAKQTFTVPADGQSLRLEIRGRFVGDVNVSQVRLYKK